MKWVLLVGFLALIFFASNKVAANGLYSEEVNMIHGGGGCKRNLKKLRTTSPIAQPAGKQLKSLRKPRESRSMGIVQEMRMQTEWGPRPGDAKALLEPIIEDYRGEKHFILTAKP